MAKETPGRTVGVQSWPLKHEEKKEEIEVFVIITPQNHMETFQGNKPPGRTFEEVHLLDFDKIKWRLKSKNTQTYKDSLHSTGRKNSRTDNGKETPGLTLRYSLSVSNAA